MLIAMRTLHGIAVFRIVEGDALYRACELVHTGKYTSSITGTYI